MRFLLPLICDSTLFIFSKIAIILFLLLSYLLILLLSYSYYLWIYIYIKIVFYAPPKVRVEVMSESGNEFQSIKSSTLKR